MTARAAALVVVSVFLLVGALSPLASAGSRTFEGNLSSSGTSWRSHTFQVTQAGTIQATYQATSTGTWKIGIKAKSGSTDYTLDVTYPSSSAVVSPAFVATIGGGTSGHADLYPSGLDVDGSANVYVADTGNDRVEKYSASGALVWTVGTRGTKVPGRFENPRDVAYLAGKVYVADTGYNRVQVLNASDGSVDSVWPKRFGTIMGISAGVDGSGAPIILVSESSAHTIRVYAPNGSLIRSVGSGPGTGVGQLNAVRDAATDADGNIYAADYQNSRIVRFGPLGGALGSWGVNGTGPQHLKRPYGIDLDPSGNVYVADSNNYIHKFTSEGVFLAAYGSPGTGPGQFEMLRRVAVGPGADPAVYGADLWTYSIQKYAQGGAYLSVIGGGGPANGSFNEPYGFAVDDQQLFAADMVNQRLVRFGSSSPFGFQLAWGERGWGEGNPGFNWPRDAAIGSNGGSRSIWVADTKNNRFTEFWPSGAPTGRKFGSSGAAVGQLKWPHAVVAIGSDLIVADTKNNRIERWNPAGPSVEWVVGAAGGQSFNSPKDVTVFDGEVYVADTSNQRVVVLNALTGAFVRQLMGSALHRIEGVAVEPNGDLWVADTTWNRLIEFSPTGSVLQTYGSLGTTDSKFNKPVHLEILATGGQVRLFVMDSWNDRIQVYDIG